MSDWLPFPNPKPCGLYSQATAAPSAPEAGTCCTVNNTPYMAAPGHPGGVDSRSVNVLNCTTCSAHRLIILTAAELAHRLTQVMGSRKAIRRLEVEAESGVLKWEVDAVFGMKWEKVKLSQARVSETEKERAREIIPLALAHRALLYKGRFETWGNASLGTIRMASRWCSTSCWCGIWRGILSAGQVLMLSPRLTPSPLPTPRQLNCRIYPFIHPSIPHDR